MKHDEGNKEEKEKNGSGETKKLFHRLTPWSTQCAIGVILRLLWVFVNIELVYRTKIVCGWW